MLPYVIPINSNMDLVEPSFNVSTNLTDLDLLRNLDFGHIFTLLHSVSFIFLMFFYFEAKKGMVKRETISEDRNKRKALNRERGGEFELKFFFFFLLKILEYLTGDAAQSSRYIADYDYHSTRTLLRAYQELPAHKRGTSSSGPLSNAILGILFSFIFLFFFTKVRACRCVPRKKM